MENLEKIIQLHAKDCENENHILSLSLMFSQYGKSFNIFYKFFQINVDYYHKKYSKESISNHECYLFDIFLSKDLNFTCWNFINDNSLELCHYSSVGRGNILKLLFDKEIIYLYNTHEVDKLYYFKEHLKIIYYHLIENNII